MAKYHVRDTGEPGRCIAKEGNCKYGATEDQHYATKEAAREAFEKQSADQQFRSMKKNKLKDMSPIDKIATVGIRSELISNGDYSLYSELIDEGYRPVCADTLKMTDSHLRIRADQLVSKNMHPDWDFSAVSPEVIVEIFSVQTRGNTTKIGALYSGDEYFNIEVANDSLLMVTSDDSRYDNSDYNFEKDHTRVLEKNAKEKLAKISRVKQSLESNLDYSGPSPAWLKNIQEDSRELFPGSADPKIIDVIDSPAGQLAVVWSDHSTKDGDISIQNERGFTIRETSLINIETGAKLGYMKTSFMDSESSKRSFGDDEWSSLRYMDEFQGTSFGVTQYVDIEPIKKINKFGKERIIDYKKINVLDEAKTSEERFEAKKRIWARSHRALNLTPESHREDLNSVSLNNLNESHAPSSEAELDNDLKEIRKITDKKYSDFKKGFETPYVDFSRTEDPIKGSGLGSALYIYAGRMLGKENKVLRESGTQSDSAGGVWSRFSKNDKIPVNKMVQKYNDDDKGVECYYIDFREKK